MTSSAPPATKRATRLTSRDFTLVTFRRMLQAALAQGYRFCTFADFARGAEQTRRVVVLRHDVDRLPTYSVRTAELESALGICGTYYFRIVPGSFDPAAIRRICDLGHEVGYHYEDLALERGDRPRALVSFERNLARLREICPIRTICMHGSPTSQWNNRDLWSHADEYRRHGICAEPYLDVDFSRVGYLTDTGRRWDGAAVSVRDKVDSSLCPPLRTTFHVIEALVTGRLPRQLMITVHPQRWTDSLVGWTRELVSQAAKNQVKRVLVLRHS